VLRVMKEKEGTRDVSSNGSFVLGRWFHLS
jgi:hypothetical protein